MHQVHGLFAKAAVNGLTELLPLIADQSGLPEGTRQLLELLHQAATQLMAGQPTGVRATVSVSEDSKGGGPGQGHFQGFWEQVQVCGNTDALGKLIGCDFHGSRCACGC